MTTFIFLASSVNFLFLTVFVSFVFCCLRISDDIGRGKKVQSSSREAKEDRIIFDTTDRAGNAMRMQMRITARNFGNSH